MNKQFLLKNLFLFCTDIFRNNLYKADAYTLAAIFHTIAVNVLICSVPVSDETLQC